MIKGSTSYNEHTANWSKKGFGTVVTLLFDSIKLTVVNGDIHQTQRIDLKREIDSECKSLCTLFRTL